MNSSINKNFWKSKKVLITGHTGFKGSWLSLWLQHLQAEVIGYSLEPPTKPSLFEIANIESGMISIYGDVRDYNHLYKVCSQYKPDVIIHMAAQSLVKFSYDNPVETFTTNITGTMNVLEVSRKTNCCKSIVVVTSDKCYENKLNNRDHIETDAMGGHDPYSSSKACAELVSAAYIKSFFDIDKEIAVATARAGNAIGGGDWAKDRLITDIIHSCKTDIALEIRYPESIRPWQHVLEPLSGYLVLAEKLYIEGHKYSGAWNFGPERESSKTVQWIIEKISDIRNKKIDWSVIDSTKLYEADYLMLDCNKAETELLWRPQLSIENTLKWIVEWYERFEEGVCDMKSFTISQIEKYEMLN